MKVGLLTFDYKSKIRCKIVDACSVSTLILLCVGGLGMLVVYVARTSNFTLPLSQRSFSIAL